MEQKTLLTTITQRHAYIFYPLPLPLTNRIWPGLTEFGPPMWQAVADTELTLSASPATAVGQILLTMAKFC